MQTERCLGCMNEYDASFDVCPHCGYVRDTPPKSRNHLSPGTMLIERYLIGRCLGQGGFGITYIAWDTRLYKKVAIKEFMPISLASRITGQMEITCYNDEAQARFRSGIMRMLDESRRLARFNELESVVKVYDCFEANGTAYIIMELLEGENAKVILEENGPMDVAEVCRIMKPVLLALREIHAAGLIHRDISPDNIFLCKNGKVKLLDFGSARVASGADNKSLSVILKPGYAPQEQYSGNAKQGPYTDVYAVCATIYKMLTGVTPIDSLARRAQDDELQPIEQLANVPHALARVIMNGMTIPAEDRLQTVDPLLEVFDRMGGSTEGPLPPKPFPLKKLLIAVFAVLVIGAAVFVVPKISDRIKTDTASVVSETETETTVTATLSSEYTPDQETLLADALLATLPADKLPKPDLRAQYEKKYGDSRTFDAEEGAVCLVYSDAKGKEMLREHIQLPDEVKSYTLFRYTKDGAPESRITYLCSDVPEDEKADPPSDTVKSAERYFYNKDGTLFAKSVYSGNTLSATEVYDEYNTDGTPASMEYRADGKTERGDYDYADPSCITLERRDDADRKTYYFKEYTSDGRTEENWYISGSNPSRTVICEKTADGRMKKYTLKLSGRDEKIYQWDYKDGNLIRYAVAGRDNTPESSVRFVYQDEELQSILEFNGEGQKTLTYSVQNNSYETFLYSDNKIVESVVYDAEGQDVERWQYEEQTDNTFNRVMRRNDDTTAAQEGWTGDVRNWRKEYDSQERLTADIKYDEKGDVVSKTLYSFSGSNKNPVSIKKYGEDQSKPEAYGEYTYDSGNNWTKQVLHDSEGTETRIEYRSLLKQDWYYINGTFDRYVTHNDEIQRP